MACATLRYQTILSGKYIFYHSQKLVFSQKHPVNPLILDILILTILSGKYIFYHSQKPIFSQKHPVNPLILDILIWLAPRYAIRQFYEENIFSIIHKTYIFSKTSC
jgi:hypothetical protein